MVPVSIDLNADLGESFGRWRLGDDEALLDVVTSANVACGFHAGDPATLLTTCRRAVERGVAIGAHVAYRDLAGFGRRFVDVDPEELYADVLYQVGALDGIARSVGGRVAYVKPHGALYHAVARHPGQAGALAMAVAAWHQPLALVGAPGSAAFGAAAPLGVRCVAEGFADRAYTTDGRLVERTEPGAVIEDVAQVASRALRLATARQVTAVDGRVIDVDVETICLHGDTPGAARLARSVRQLLDEAGIELRSFVGAR